jgi:hypothetical protein
MDRSTKAWLSMFNQLSAYLPILTTAPPNAVTAALIADNTIS